MPDLSGTVALVTGASGGIGAGIARRFAAAGAAVADGITANGGRAILAQADVTDPDQCGALMGAALERFGRLDAVVASAGIQPVAELATMTRSDWREVVETNLTGACATTQAASAVMRDGRGGSITIVASVEGSQPAPAHAHYAASKAAVIMFARSAALEYGRAGVRVNTVSPGLVRRDGIEEAWPDGVERWRQAVPLGRLGESTDVADACLFLASPMARWITGHDLVVDGGMSVAPPW